MDIRSGDKSELIDTTYNEHMEHRPAHKIVILHPES